MASRPNPWGQNDQLRVLVSLLGPVIDVQASEVPAALWRPFFMEASTIVPQVMPHLERPGFLARLPAVDGALESLREMEDARDTMNTLLVAPAHMAWRRCRADMYAWLEAHLSMAWAERLVLARYRSGIRGHRLLSTYPECCDWAGAQWDLIWMDDPTNRVDRGPRMYGWSDADGLVGDWFDRIPWVDHWWHIEESNHFSISVHDRGDSTYLLSVFVERRDASTSFTAVIRDRVYDLGPAALRPREAGRILLARSREWTVDRDETFTGPIAEHPAFEWGGRGW